MSSRYVWGRYSTYWDYARTSMGGSDINVTNTTLNRPIWYQSGGNDYPSVSSSGGYFTSLTRTGYISDSDSSYSAKFVAVEENPTECYGPGSGYTVYIEYYSSSQIRIYASGSRTIYRYYTTRVRGTLQNYVSRASSSAYPSNGLSGSYWYVYQGADSIDPAAVSLPESIFGGDTVTVTVTPSAGKTYGGTVSYLYQYRLDGGSWQTLATTTAASQTLTVPAGTNTVEVRVLAGDDLGFTSSTYVSSGAVTVTNNLAPTAPGSISVTAPVAGEPVTVTVTPASDEDGTVEAYLFERQADGGEWQQVQSGPALTFTETVGAWQSVQYRAAAVDNEGAQGPYVESGALAVSTGAVSITGPAAALGEQRGPFAVTVTLGVTPAPSDPAVQFAAALDGAGAVSAAHAAGDAITLRIDPRVMARGAHTLTLTASKEAYTTAMTEYTYTIPDWDGADVEGGVSGVMQTPDGRPLLPKTLAQDCLGPGGVDMATALEQLQGEVDGLDPIPLEPVVKAAPPSGSYELQPGVLYDFSQAAASALTLAFAAPASGKAAQYHLIFASGSTATAVTLPDGVRTPDGYTIEAGRVYELSILEGLLTYQSWESAT